MREVREHSAASRNPSSPTGRSSPTQTFAYLKPPPRSPRHLIDLLPKFTPTQEDPAPSVTEEVAEKLEEPT